MAAVRSCLAVNNASVLRQNVTAVYTHSTVIVDWQPAAFAALFLYCEVVNRSMKNVVYFVVAGCEYVSFPVHIKLSSASVTECVF